MATSSVATYKKSFLKRKGMLSALAAKLNDASEDALAELVRLSKTSEDEKLKKECAEIILKTTISFAEIRNNDSMARMLAEFKYNPDTLTAIPGEDDDTPQLDFTTVQFDES